MENEIKELEQNEQLQKKHLFHHFNNKSKNYFNELEN